MVHGWALFAWEYGDGAPGFKPRQAGMHLLQG
jgi:hypothetical protein